MQFAPVDVIILLAVLLDGDVGEMDIPSKYDVQTGTRVGIIRCVNLAYLFPCRLLLLNCCQNQEQLAP